ncbi:MOSC domain-containing protein [Bacillus ectoiniformans]|uniref:MOSC domain-containing protein n=1 Tax=Bacillus ectoiniformans TaxID=1494429 RepID=UPI00195A242A|nr:MOSC domain-containing protein [Bacillus ectoiniformans]
MTYGEKQVHTAICKDIIEEAFLTKDGFRGDDVADKKHHGGPDRAVCVYPYEHYQLWEKEFHTVLPPAAFGENLTVAGMLEQDVCIGDIYRLGDAVIQVTQGRVPCSTITKRIPIPELLKRLVDTGFTGYLCRVLEEGVVRKDSSIELIERHPMKVSIQFTNEVKYHQKTDKEAIRKILNVKELADEWRDSLEKRTINDQGTPE